MSLNIGDSIPEFSLINYDKEKYESKDSLGRKTMFVFMPFPIVRPPNFQHVSKTWTSDGSSRPSAGLRKV